jgi:DoxX-like family
MAIEVSNRVGSKKMLWTGRIVSWVIAALLLLDAVMKVLQVPQVMEGTVKVGYPAGTVRPIGIILLLCLICYVIPRTSVLGAILLTGYLGGAVATNVRISTPLFSYTLIPMYVGVLVWGGLFLQDEGVRALIPLRKDSHS